MLYPTILNAANEVAVALFLNQKISFLDISKVIEEALNYFDSEAKQEVELENILKLDQKDREYVSEIYN